jgi:hypothetical protein
VPEVQKHESRSANLRDRSENIEKELRTKSIGQADQTRIDATRLFWEVLTCL